MGIPAVWQSQRIWELETLAAWAGSVFAGDIRSMDIGKPDYQASETMIGETQRVVVPKMMHGVMVQGLRTSNTIDNGRQCHKSESKGKDDRKIHYVSSLIYYVLGFIHLFNSTSEILKCPESAAH